MWFGHLQSINCSMWMLHMMCHIKQNYFLFHTTQLNPMWPNRVYSSSHASRIFAGSPGECCRMETILFPATLLICVLLCCWSQRFGVSLWAKHIAIPTRVGSCSFDMLVSYCRCLQHFQYEIYCWIKHPVLVDTWLIKQMQVSFREFIVPKGKWFRMVCL